MDQPDLVKAMQAILGAGLNPALWQSALGELGQLAGGMKVHLLHADSMQSHAERSVETGYDPEFLQTWDAHYERINAWAPRMVSAPVGQPIPAEAMLAFDAIRRTEFYHGWVRPQEDLLAGGAMVLSRKPGQITIFGGNIGLAWRDRLEEPWLQTLEILGPAVQAAIAMNAALLGASVEVLLARQGLGGPEDQAVLILDQTQRPIWANGRMETALASGEVLRMMPGARLGCALPEAAAAMERCLRGLGPPLIRRLPLRPETLRVIPLTEAMAAGLRLPPLTPGRRAAAVVMLGRDHAPAERAGQLARLLHLSRAEAETVLALAEGMTLKAIAETREVSLHTVRNQLKSALAKTGCHRQAELVLRVARLLHAGEV